jgi:hypothetical protein
MKWIGVSSSPNNNTNNQHLMMTGFDEYAINQSIQIACIQHMIIQPIVIDQRTPSIISVLTQTSFPTLQLRMCPPVDCQLKQHHGLCDTALYQQKRKELRINLL